MLKTGIPKLDESLRGGIKEGSVSVFYSEPGVENAEFAYELVFSNLKNNANVFYFVNNKKPETVKEIMRHYGWDTTSFESNDKFFFIDAYSALIGGAPGNFYVNNPMDVKSINSVLIDVIRKHKNSIIVFDALSSFLDLEQEPEVLLRYLEDWVESSRKNNVTLVLLFTEWMYNEEVINKIKEMADFILELKSLETNIILRKYFSVLKANWVKNLVVKDIPFKVIRPGGVRVYIPKILVTGPYHAGKTSFVQSASIRAVSVNRVGTTIALDFGHVDLKGFAVDIFGTPGQERFDPLLEMLGRESFGVILVIDSTNPESFVRAKEMLEKTKTKGLPIVIAANKADLAGALPPEKIRSKMNLPKGIPIIPVTAEDQRSIQPGKPCKLKKKETEKVLVNLLEMVI
jgi:hypothetical protein